MSKQISPKIIALTFGVLVVSFLVAFYVVAWQEPAVAPPGGNVAAPINVSAIGQTKTGNLVVNALGISAASGDALIINSGANLCLGSDCRSSWPGSGSLVCTGVSDTCDPCDDFNNVCSAACPVGMKIVSTLWAYSGSPTPYYSMNVSCIGLSSCSQSVGGICGLTGNLTISCCKIQ